MKQIDYYWQTFGEPEKSECPNCGEIRILYCRTINGIKVFRCDNCLDEKIGIHKGEKENSQ